MVVDRHELFDGPDQLLPTREADSRQGFSAQNAKPDFHLVEPGDRGRREMKRHIGVCRQPVVVLLMRGEIVQNHMNLLVRRVVNHKLVHESPEVLPLLGLGAFFPRILPVATSMASNRLTIPWRL